MENLRDKVQNFLRECFSCLEPAAQGVAGLSRLQRASQISRGLLEMPKKPLRYAIGGFILGLIAALAMVFYGGSQLLFLEDQSQYGFEKSVSLLEQAASDNGWVIPKQYRLDMSLKKAGYEILPVSVIELCRPEHAAKVLGEDEYRHFSTMMPCRVSVYEKSDGTVFIARMNTGLMSYLFEPAVEEVMQAATSETENILNAIAAD